jgi:16S rRNA (uracil1498-N3)-methyltransferase
LNLILFEPDEVEAPLARTDSRAVHLVQVLRLSPGDRFDAGIVNGPLGKATLVSLNQFFIEMSFVWGEIAPALDPITLVIGLPRPQTARKVLEEATALGVGTLDFVLVDKGDPGYGKSKLWSSGEWRRHLLAGASQSFSTRIPAVTWGETLSAAIGRAAAGTRFALDNYEASQPLSLAPVAAPAIVCIGPERGWSGEERDRLREEGFALVHLGPRVLRVETACVVALALVKARLGLV